MVKKLNKGFTLIEVIVYIALFSIIIGGGMVATYGIIQSTDNGANHVILQEEANFLLRKINWALTGATTVNVFPPTRLEVTNNSGSYTFNLCGTDITIETGLGKTCASAPIKLNSNSIKASATTLFQLTGTSGYITTFTLTTAQNGRNTSQNFSTTKYLRQ